MKKLKRLGLRAFQIIGSFVFAMNALAGVSNGLAGKTSAEDCWVPLGVGLGGLLIIYLNRPAARRIYFERHRAWKHRTSSSLAQVAATYLAAWVLMMSAFATFAYLSIFSRSMLPLRQLAAHGVQTQGRVVKKGGQNADVLYYAFSVGGKTYKSADKSGFGMPEAEKLKVKDKVPVFYLPSDPRSSMLGDPKPALESERLGLVVMPFFFSAFLMIQLMWRGLLPIYKRPSASESPISHNLDGS